MLHGKWTAARYHVEYRRKIHEMLYKRGWSEDDIKEFMEKVKPLPIDGVIMLMKQIRNQTREF